MAEMSRHEAEGTVAWGALLVAFFVACAVVLNKGIAHPAVFWSVAAGFTAFNGIGCFRTWPIDPPSPPWTWLLHQYWFNAFGSFIGWLILHRLISQHEAFGAKNSDYLLALISFLGLVGCLPGTLAGVATAAADLAKKGLDAVKPD
jgi:hypothetical protein